MDRLATFLAATQADEPEAITLRALTLHILEYVAPRLFADRKLKRLQRLALTRCRKISFGLGTESTTSPLDPNLLQAGVDAWFCRHVRGLPHPAPDRQSFRLTLERLHAQEDSLYAWLLGEIAARCGLDVRLEFPPRAFRGVSKVHDSYWLTHLVMVDTDYFARPLSHSDANEWGDALEELVPWLSRKRNDDLAGEVALCLRVMGRDARGAMRLAQRAKPTSDPHAQATVLLALSVE